jgi:hypothetical protein
MDSREAEAHGALGYSFLPAAIWLAAIGFIHQSRINPIFLFLSCGLGWAVLIYYLVLAGRVKSGFWVGLRLARLRLKGLLRPAASLWGSFRDGSPARYGAAVGAAGVNAGAVVFLAFQPLERPGAFTDSLGLKIALWVLIAGLSLLWAAISCQIFARRLSRMGTIEAEALGALGYGLIPALIWLVSVVFSHQGQVVPFWLFLSCGLCWLMLFYYPLAARRTGSGDSAGLLSASLVLAFFVTPALLTGLKPIMFLIQGDSAVDTVSAIGGWLSRIQWIFPAAVALFGLFVSDKGSTVRFVFFPTQVMALLFFAVAIPDPFLVDGQFTRFYPAEPAALFIVLPLFLLGLWDCVRRCLFSGKKSLWSPFPFLAILFLVFFRQAPWPGYSNLYEVGSRFPEFWVVRQGWATLFKDVYITYGLWDYAAFLLGQVFTGQPTASVGLYGGYLLILLLMSAQFLAVSSLLPVGLAFILCFWIGAGSHSVALIYFSVLSIPWLLNRPAAWILVWALLGGFAPFAKIPQGAMCVVAGLPAFFWQAAVLYKSNRKYFWRVGGLLILWALAFMVGPFSGYFWGLFRIFSETARVNSPWAANFWQMDASVFLATVMGNAVIVAPLLAAIAAVVMVRSGNKENALLAGFMLFWFVLLYSLSSVSYGFSRTDSRAYCRQFQVLVTLLPIILTVLLARVSKRVVVSACLAVILGFMALEPHGLPRPRESLARAATLPRASSEQIQDAGLFGLPHLGLGSFPAGHLEEERALKEGLDRYLASEETFLDLTMEGMHYYSSQRPMATEYPVYYVYPGDPPQFRAIDQLRRRQVRVSLLDPVFFDETPSGLRTHYLYRFGLLGGLPLEISPQKTILMPPEYFARAGVPMPDRAEALQLLDKQFPQRDVFFTPLVWGRGYHRLAKDLSLVRTLEPAEVVGKGADREFHYSLDPPLAGTEAGLLVLEVEADPEQVGPMSVHWEDGSLPEANNRMRFMAGRGVLIIPLDASPRWLLARSINSLTLRQTLIEPGNRSSMWDKSRFRPLTLVPSHIINGRMDQPGRLEATSDDPGLFYTLPKSLQGRELLLRLVTDLPQNAENVRIYYRTPGGYDEGQSEQIPAVSGRNKMYFHIPAHLTELGEVRLDIGNAPGRYMIHSVQIRALTTESRMPLPTIIRAELRQRPMIKELGLDSLGPWADLE